MKKIIVLVGLMFVAGFALAQSIEDQNTWEYAKGKSKGTDQIYKQGERKKRSPCYLSSPQKEKYPPD